MSQTYPSAYYQDIVGVEDAHFWFLARRQMLTDLVSRILPEARATFLEVGCGTGVVLELLEKLGYRVTGLDVNAQALALARKRTRGRLVRSSLFSWKSRQKYDGVGAFDVLEHQRQDRQFLKRCYNLLTPGGFLFLTVPAGRKFWSEIDRISGHQRRYEPVELLSKINAAGFTVRFWNYWNVLTLPFFLARRSTLTVGADGPVIREYLKLPPRGLNLILRSLLNLENKLLFRLKFPIGASLVVCAEKP